MLPRMSDAELALFRCFVEQANGYVEFGAGGSTVLAASAASGFIVSTDSAQVWIDAVASQCRERDAALVPEMVLADIGPTREWGYPVDDSRRDRWSRYHQLCWERPRTTEAGLYVVDGRFRVACAMQVLIRARTGAVLLFHDFASRAHYHPVRRFAREIAAAEDLSAFLVPEGRDYPAIAVALAEHVLDPR